MLLGSKITLLPNDLNYREPQKCIRPNATHLFSLSLSLLSSNLANQRHLIASSSFDAFDNHLKTNTIGPILVAQKLLMRSGIPVGTIVFMSSDSGSAGKFLAFEDG